LLRDEPGRGDRRRPTIEEMKRILRQRTGGGRAVEPGAPRTVSAPPPRAVVSRIDNRVRTLMVRTSATRSAPGGRDDAYVFLYWKR
jgi:hypothetical protein